MILFAVSLTDLMPIVIFGAIVLGAWALMSFLSKKSSVATERLDRMNRPASAGDMGDMDDQRQRFSGL